MTMRNRPRRQPESIPPPAPPPNLDPVLVDWLEELEAWITVKVRRRVREAVARAVRLYVLPGLIIAGAATCVALVWQWADTNDRVHDQCVAAFESRDAFIRYANGQTDLWDGIIGIFVPPGQEPSGEVGTVMELVGQNAQQTASDFPPKDRTNC